ncbi:4a-hydroxytetrahydrobiopterin dehydratase [Polynucleobacter necessarius]|uniref:4a-hydroxytetrahydrobiopterin dehydratase n=1 Tax=Polynucleobacter necessarius TaxID=576610 RepID=UPI000E09966D|nr:4a-hydroxytetrahydrobiopterin dehydratase [Polynucleobacter necessarius]
MSPTLLPANFDYQGAIPLWQLHASGKKITRELTFQNFEKAFAFMMLVAQRAEEMDHHPDWSNSWNWVKIELSTHSAGGLTGLDIDLALAIDQIASQVQSAKA